ncbi:hypothetical protein GKZ68_10425 [Hymenobacter sp. BRD128]|uniref:hypothetical protein n=1 Tax=Hymenobacter sp. BRD128 TaxID=2675878 RepID=UPI00156342BA|nr:hypothetical protein [Hymenobacter sp. BRD128]QKG57005.1 hypothetical protein GKZ68_10425 [Hymenobacter sp. BRD128]
MAATTDFKPLINGRAYDWASIRFQALGQTIAGTTAISYEDTQEKVNNFGAGVNPTSRGLGKIESKASVTMEMKELERIQAALPAGGRIQDIPAFPIVVSYVNPSNMLVTHTLHDCEFTNNKREIKTGDTNIEVELELIISHITWS